MSRIRTARRLVALVSLSVAPIFSLILLGCVCYYWSEPFILLILILTVLTGLSGFIFGVCDFIDGQRWRGPAIVAMGLFCLAQIDLWFHLFTWAPGISDVVNVQIRRPFYALSRYFRSHDESGQLDVFPFGDGMDFSRFVVYDPMDDIAGPPDKDRLTPLICPENPKDCAALRIHPAGGHFYLVDEIW